MIMLVVIYQNHSLHSMIDVALQREDLIIVKRYLKAEPHANGVVDLIRRSIITLLDHFLLGLHYIYKHAGSLLAPDLSARRTHGHTT